MFLFLIIGFVFSDIYKLKKGNDVDFYKKFPNFLYGVDHEVDLVVYCNCNVNFIIYVDSYWGGMDASYVVVWRTQMYKKHHLE